MALLAVANAYTMRVCLNLAITQMVKKTASAHASVSVDYDPLVCQDQNAISANTSDVRNFYATSRADDVSL